MDGLMDQDAKNLFAEPILAYALDVVQREMYLLVGMRARRMGHAWHRTEDELKVLDSVCGNGQQTIDAQGESEI
jgi:hypothetical protein